MDRIRVAQVVGRMNKGGVEATVMNLFRHTDHDRFKFDFIVQDDSSYVPREEIENLGGSIHSIAPYKRISSYFHDLRRVFEETRPDIVHANVNALSVFPLGVAKRAGIPIRIAHSHSTAHSSELAKTMMKNALRPFSKTNATDLAACGELSARWLFGNRAVNDGRVHIIHNAIDLGYYAAPTDIDTKRRELGIPQGLVVGQVGRLCVQKNQAFTLKVFAALLHVQPDATLVLVGAGSRKGMLGLEHEAEQLGIRDRVRFLGGRDDVSDLYHMFDVMIFPSKYEGLPLSLVEAQAAGCPTVVSTEVTKEVNIVPGMIVNLPLSGSPDEWARKLVEIGRRAPRDDAERKRDVRFLTDAGYAIEDSAKQVNAWYEELVSRAYERKAQT